MATLRTTTDFVLGTSGDGWTVTRAILPRYQQLAAHEITRRILSIHTSPEQMNEICRRTQPRLALLNHISLWRITQYDVLRRVRAQSAMPLAM